MQSEIEKIIYWIL